MKISRKEPWLWIIYVLTVFLVGLYMYGVIFYEKDKPSICDELRSQREHMITNDWLFGLKDNSKMLEKCGCIKN